MSHCLRVFIGYDAREAVAFQVLAHSIWRHATIPVSITPLVRTQLGRHYTRERGPTESTDFAMTRFLVPYLCGYQGQAVFMDCDMLCQADLCELLVYALAHPTKAVHLCQHDYVPKTSSKFLGQVQTAYPRKNWSSLMLFNNARCDLLTPAYVNTASGLQLHRFSGFGDEDLGALPLEWNWLVGEYDPKPDAKLLHYTLGGPWFGALEGDPESVGRWRAEYDRMTALELA